MSNTSTVSGPLRQFHPVFWQKTFTDGPTSARSSKLLSRGATGVLKSTGSISRVYTASTRSISGFCTADTLYTPKYFGVRYYCGYSGTCSTLTAHTPSTRSIMAFGTAHIPSTRSIQAFSTARTPSTRSTKCTRYSEYTRSTKYTGSICETYVGNTNTVEKRQRYSLPFCSLGVHLQGCMEAWMFLGVFGLESRRAINGNTVSALL